MALLRQRPRRLPIRLLRLSPTPPLPGGKLHGVVKSGNVPLPGVTVTAQNTLTGKRFATTTDITGAWSMTIPQNGRYVIRTQFAAFAPGSQEALLNAANHDQTVNFDLMLASRAAEQEQQQAGQAAEVQQAIRQLAGNGAQSLSLMSALTGDTDAGTTGGSGQRAARRFLRLPATRISAAIRLRSMGRAGSVSPLAGVDMDRVRDFVESMRAQNGGQGPGGRRSDWRRPVRAAASSAVAEALAGVASAGGGFGGGGFGGGVAEVAAGAATSAASIPASRTEPSSGRAAIRRLNAEPFSLRGQPQEQPASGHQPLRRHLHERAVHSRA